jgi:hypothetical protein
MTTTPGPKRLHRPPDLLAHHENREIVDLT